MIQLTITESNQFTPAIDWIRKEGFFKNESIESTRDEFDDHSKHLLLSFNTELVGYVRLTMPPPSVIFTWSQGKVKDPFQEHVIEYNRFVIAPKWQRLGLPSVFAAEALLYAYQRGFIYGAALVDPVVVSPMLVKLGFDILEADLDVEFMNHRVKGNLMTMNLTEKLDHIHDYHERAIQKVHQNQIHVQSTVSS